MPNNLTKRQLVQTIYEGKDYKQDEIRVIVQETLDLIADTLASGKGVELRNFGIFELQVRKARMGRNPKIPGSSFHIPARAVVKFRAGKELKRKLDQLDLDQLDS